MATPYEGLLDKLIEGSRHKLAALEARSASEREIKRLRKEITELEARLKSYQTGVSYFRKKEHAMRVLP